MPNEIRVEEESYGPMKLKLLDKMEMKVTEESKKWKSEKLKTLSKLKFGEAEEVESSEVPSVSEAVCWDLKLSLHRWVMITMLYY